MRKPFQGLLNIVRFNWHFYLLGLAVVFMLLLIGNFLPEPYQVVFYAVCALAIAAVLVSLLVSCYVYDFSNLYVLDWIKPENKAQTILNIHAGFDETSILLKNKFEGSELLVFDFYNPEKHTEISIERARKAYPPYPGTKQVETGNLPLDDNSVDKIFVIFSAHEIRNREERHSFFRELHRILKPNGKINLVEHLRDLPNFLAYNFGAFHFHPKSNWLKTFENASVLIQKEIKHTPFVSIFTLQKNGNPL